MSPWSFSPHGCRGQRGRCRTASIPPAGASDLDWALTDKARGRAHGLPVKGCGRRQTLSTDSALGLASSRRRPEPGAVTALPHQLEPLAELAERQGGVLSRAQARQYAITRHTIRNQIMAQRWQRFGSRVVILHNGPLTTAQRRWGALLHAGPGAALAGLTAAEVDGLAGYPSESIHVVAPIDARVPPLPGLRVHRSRHLGIADVHPLRAPRRTRIARSLVDAAVWAPDDDRACALLAAGVQQRLVQAAALRAVLQRPGRLPRRRLLLLAAGDIEGGSHSLAEIDFIRLCRRHRLPAPDRQALRPDASGRRRWLDADWDAYRTAVEVDGGAHRQVRQWWADLARQNEVVLGGRRVLRFPATVIRLHEDDVAAQLARALRQGGWRGWSK